MIKNLLSRIFKREKKIHVSETKMTIDPLKVSTQQEQKSSGYRSEVKEKYGFDLPASDVEKIHMGKQYENDGGLEKACACYEGCLKNRFNGNGPYDRLIILYKKLDRPADVMRVVKKAITIFEKVAEQGRSDGVKKLEKYKDQLKKLLNE